MVKYWLALQRAPGIGPGHFALIWQQFPQLADFFQQDKSFWAQHGFSHEQQSFFANPPWAAIEQDLAWAEQPDHHVITLQDPAYPTLLKETVGAPPVLYLQGDPSLLAQPQIAIVGSRHPTSTGREDAYEFARELANHGITITSGLATGIDAAAHEGALAVPGKTIAIAGCGLDRVYPVKNTKLAAKIRENGAIVSEYWPGTAPLAEHFPQRNRIVSGLSVGTLVVEAALQSGSLITARLALEQGREVFAIPGSIHNPVARGCHHLIRQGAHLVETAADIIAELGALLGAMAVTGAPQKQPLQRTALASEAENLLKCVGFEPTAIDHIIIRSGLAASKVSAKLIELELAGYILPVVGGYMRATA